MQDYRIERARREIERDAQTNGYETEASELPPIMTFKDWLGMHAGQWPNQHREEPPWTSEN